VNKEKATNENNELLGKTEFYSWKFVCIRGSNCHLMPELNFSQSPLSSQRFCSYQLSSSPLLFMFSFLPLLMSASPQTSPTSLCQRELNFSQSPLSSRRFCSYQLSASPQTSSTRLCQRGLWLEQNPTHPQPLFHCGERGVCMTLTGLSQKLSGEPLCENIKM
jgi:hypothetical protein